MGVLQGIVRFTFHADKVEEFKRLSAECLEIVLTKAFARWLPTKQVPKGATNHDALTMRWRKCTLKLPTQIPPRP